MSPIRKASHEVPYGTVMPCAWRRAVIIGGVAAAAIVGGAPAAVAAVQAGAPQPAPAAATMATRLRFAFGTDTSPVPDGYTKVTEKTVYSRKRGYGWHLGDEVFGRDRERGDALRRSLDFGGWIEFLVDLPNGTYDVTVTMGDATGAHDEMGLILQGKLVDSVTTASGQFHVKTYPVTVSTGQLSVVLDDLGGENLDAVINGLEIAPAGAPR